MVRSTYRSCYWLVLLATASIAGCSDAPDASESVGNITSSVTALQIAQRWAPVHYQDVNKQSNSSALSGLADYMTSFDYDGDMLGRNNWDNLSKFTTVPAIMHYSVTESSSHYFIYYMAYHPRSWCSNSICDEHENDGEGCMMLVRKDGSTFGVLESVMTMFHNDWLSYKAASYVGKGTANISNPPLIQMEAVGGLLHPRTYQEPAGHGFIGCTATSNCVRGDDGIRYFPSTTAGFPPNRVPDGVQVSVGYVLSEMSPMLFHRYDAPTYSTPNTLAGDSSGSCNDNGIPRCTDDAAVAMWAHADGDNTRDDNNGAGEEPAFWMGGMFSFGGLPAPSTNYVTRPFMHQICTAGRRMQGAVTGSSCVSQVCAVAPSCCSVSWTSACVALVGSVCQLSCSNCDKNICTPQAGPIGNGCASGCAAQVCAQDSFCCTNSWDNICVSEVTSICHLGC